MFHRTLSLVFYLKHNYLLKSALVSKNKEFYYENDKAVELSMTRYCRVSAMISKAVTIYYHIFLNENKLINGQTKI